MKNHMYNTGKDQFTILRKYTGSPMTLKTRTICVCRAVVCQESEQWQSLGCVHTYGMTGIRPRPSRSRAGSCRPRARVCTGPRGTETCRSGILCPLQMENTKRYTQTYSLLLRPIEICEVNTIKLVN